MKSNKFILMALIFLVSLLCVSAVSAADDTASDVVADTNDVTVLEESIDDANLADSQSDENILKDDPEPPHYEPGFAYLDNLIKTGGNEIELQSDIEYKEDDNLIDGIVIDHDLIINGNNHTIDGKNTARIFRVTGNSAVTFKDINFVNGKASGAAGGAILSERSQNVKAINCNFTGNNASYGAVAGVNVENCIFENNYAVLGGGAMVNGSATNCTFINNNGKWYGGAIYGWLDGINYFAKNCTFINNTATHGGAISNVNAIDCNFIGNNVECRGGAILEGNATNCNFTQNKAGERGGAIYNGTAINCNFNQNNATVDGGGLYLGNARDCTFNENHAEYGAGMYDGNATNCTFTKNNVSNIGGAILKVNADECIFINNSAANEGGAMSESNATNCEFTGNHAENGGGAIYNGNATACNFTQNNAEGGGAIAYGIATNCTFTQNSACIGGAIYHGDATNSTFIQNSASENGGAIYEGNAIGCNFTGNNATYGGAMSDDGAATNCTFIQNSASEDGGAMKDISATNCTFRENSASMGGAMSGGKASNCEFILNTASSPDTNDLYGGVSMPEEDCKFIKPEFGASDLNTTYNYGDKFNFNLSTDDEVFDGENVTISIYKNGTFVANYTALSGEGWTVNLLAGTYQAVLSIPGSNVAPLTKTIDVAKNPTKITASAVTTTYNVNKYLVVTLTDGKGNRLSGIKLTVKVGTISKTVKTDKNGQIKINLAKKVPKTYKAKISFAGNASYIASSKTVKVTVKKAAAKMTAKKKTFKCKVKVKKYTIVLKNNIKKAIKGAKVTLKVNKKTFKAKTNKKGKAVFKIKNLKKKGTYKAVIKFAGNKYYKKVTKKVKIRVKR